MKKILSFILVLLPVLSLTALADTIPNPISDAFKDIPTAITTISQVILPLTALVFMVVLIIAGFYRMTAAGNPEKEKKAMQVIQSAIIGLVIILLSTVIVGTVFAILGVKSIFQFNNP
jgi:hypothetical protein